MTDVTLKDIREFFDTKDRPMTMGDFRKEWVPLPQADKDHIKNGMTNGSMTY